MKLIQPAGMIAGRFSCPELKPMYDRLPAIRQLDRRGVFSIRAKSGTRILCRGGCIWITCNGDSKDLILSVGESIETTRRTSVVIEALEEAVIEIGGS